MKNKTAKAMTAIINIDMLPPWMGDAGRAYATHLMPLAATMVPSPDDEG